jgi:hypothetical protein
LQLLEGDLLRLIASNFDGNNTGLLGGNKLVLFLSGELGLLLDDTFVLLED